MKDIKILGVDIAKDVFQLCGIDEWGKVIYTRRVKRAQYVSTVASLKVGCVVMEAGDTPTEFETMRADESKVKPEVD